MTVIGFTGSRAGMTAPQIKLVKSLFRLSAGGWLLHGDCVGADALAHELGKDSLRIGIYPPTDDRQRAFCQGAEYVADPLPFLERDDVMMDRCELAIATPKGMKEELRSGTWHTIRYADKIKRWLLVVWPDGTISPHNVP